MKISPWMWLQTHGIRRFPSVPASSDHRLLWGWIRLALGLTQMAFSATTAYLLITGGLHWRAVVAALIATTATGASRYLFGGRPDPRLEASLRGKTSIEPNGRSGGR